MRQFSSSPVRPRTPHRLARATAAVVASLALVAVAPALAASAAAPGTVATFDSVPATLAPSYPSLGYQATSTDEFGDLIQLAGTERELEDVTVVFASWACETGTWNAACDSPTPGATFTHPVTVNVYAAGAPTPGALLASVTETITAPYRPSPDPANCGAGTTQWYDAGAASCQNGLAFSWTFDLPTATLPDEVVVTVAYDTQTHGASPLGVTGPYDALNVAVTGTPTVGTDPDVDTVYWDTVAAFYSDAGAGGVDFLRADTGWAADATLMIRVRTSPAVVAAAPTLAETGAPLNLPLLAGAGVVVALGIALTAVAGLAVRGRHRAAPRG